jgi:hypothetical protein
MRMMGTEELDVAPGQVNGTLRGDAAVDEASNVVAPSHPWLRAAFRYELGPVRSETLWQEVRGLLPDDGTLPGPAGVRAVCLDLRQSLRPLYRILSESQPNGPADVLTQAAVLRVVPGLWARVRDLGWPGPAEPVGGLREASLRSLPAKLAAGLRDRTIAAHEAALDDNGLCDTSWACLTVHCAEDIILASAQLEELHASDAGEIRRIGRTLRAEVETFPDLLEGWCQVERERRLIGSGKPANFQ